MKNIIKTTIGCMAMLMTVACGDMYEIHEKYLAMGEETYLGIPSDLEANTGFNRIQLKWKLNADPRISKCIITWGEGSEDSVEIPIPENRNVDDYIETILNLPEGRYIFNIASYSDTGKQSLVQTISGEVYGQNYQDGLYAQAITSITADLEAFTIQWASTEGCLKTEMTYTTVDGEKKTLTVLPDETETRITDAELSTTFTFRSYYQPESVIDVISTNLNEMTFPAYRTALLADWDAVRSQYTELEVGEDWVVTANTEELTGEGAINGHKECIIDGDINTFWHSEWWNSARPPLPHELIIDMQKTQTIQTIELYRRIQSGVSNKDLKTALFYISDDNENWTEVGEMNFPNADTPIAKTILLPEAVEGRYFRILVTDSNNGVNASIGEIKFTIGKSE